MNELAEKIFDALDAKTRILTHLSNSVAKRRYVVGLIDSVLAEAQPSPDAWKYIDEFIGTVEGPRDMSDYPKQVQGGSLDEKITKVQLKYLTHEVYVSLLKKADEFDGDDWLTATKYERHAINAAADLRDTKAQLSAAQAEIERLKGK